MGMAFDFTAFKGVVGVLKIVSLFVALITLGVTGDCLTQNTQDVPVYGRPQHISEPRDYAYVSVICLCWISSLVFAVLWLLLLKKTKLINHIDSGFHIVAAFALLITAIYWFESVDGYRSPKDFAKENGRPYNEPKEGPILYGKKHNVEKDQFPEYHIITYDQFLERIFAGIFGLITSCVYVCIGIFLYDV